MNELEELNLAKNLNHSLDLNAVTAINESKNTSVRNLAMKTKSMFSTQIIGSPIEPL
jgi:hypothetical protein